MELNYVHPYKNLTVDTEGAAKLLTDLFGIEDCRKGSEIYLEDQPLAYIERMLIALDLHVQFSYSLELGAYDDEDALLLAHIEKEIAEAKTKELTSEFARNIAAMFDSFKGDTK